MKKVIVLTAVALVTAATAGCTCDWFRTGSLFPMAAYCDPCSPAVPCDPCSPCGPSGSCESCESGVMTVVPGVQAMPAPTLLPGPGPAVITQ